MPAFNILNKNRICLTVPTLLGTTTAWFTATVESRGHEIYIGVLDIDLSNTEGSLKDTTKNIKLFDSVKRWGATATAVEQLTVADKGDLAFKYQMFLAPGEANSAISDGAREEAADD